MSEKHSQTTAEERERRDAIWEWCDEGQLHKVGCPHDDEDDESECTCGDLYLASMWKIRLQAMRGLAADYRADADAAVNHDSLMEELVGALTQQGIENPDIGWHLSECPARTYWIMYGVGADCDESCKDLCALLRRVREAQGKEEAPDAIS